MEINNEDEPKIIVETDEQQLEPDNEKRWRLSHLKRQFESLNLDELFQRYIERISHGYFSQFLSLQIIVITGHFVILLSTGFVNKTVRGLLPDVILYGVTALISLVFLVVTDTCVKKKPRLLRFLSGSAFILTFFMNFFVPFYTRYRSEAVDNLHPAYTVYLIISNYIFLNIHNDIVTLIIGTFVTICHIVTLLLVTYEKVENGHMGYRIGADSLYLICINCLGMYFRYMNEIVIRRSFLDRSDCIKATHLLKFEEEQENSLMSNIIPQHIIEEVRQILKDQANSHNGVSKYFGKLYVTEHPNVSILFADIVNYTALTTQLKVTDLLDILNELFSRFDTASEELKVLRIKFLGDCYYCVAGLPPNSIPKHAEACVDLGLKMIEIIAEISNRKNQDIKMRIGVHSGKVSSGIIGELKWQYDIWSTDVDIANQMESEGKPGQVHITEATRKLLSKPYHKISVTDKLINSERTYLITPQPMEEINGTSLNIIEDNNKSQKEKLDPDNKTEEQRQSTIYVKHTDRSSIRGSYSLIADYQKKSLSKTDVERTTLERLALHERRKSEFGKTKSGNFRLPEVKRRTAFMNVNIKRYKERMEETNQELKSAIENMPLSKFEQWFRVNDIYRILMVFKDLKSELEFVKTPDPLFKYYLLSELLLIVIVFILEGLSTQSLEWNSWPFYVTIGLMVVFLLPMTWTHHVWTKYFSKSNAHMPTNKLVVWLFQSSKFITNNVCARFIIYTVVYTLFCLCVLYEMLTCSTSDRGLVKQPFLLLMMRSYDERATTTCTISWHMTQTSALAIIMSFLFLRMYMWLKLFYAAIIALVYSSYILEMDENLFNNSMQTFNYDLSPQISRAIAVIFLTITLHLVDRQTEHMNRMDHVWYKKLKEKEQKANEVSEMNKELLRNVLPKHVVDIYLNINRSLSEEIYNENYDNASVMFATLTNYSEEDMGPRFLSVMNEIISEFDKLLFQCDYGKPIEKIKIAKWTYMAASGLAPGMERSDDICKDSKSHTVIAILNFAAGLMQTLKALNCENFQQMKLRIGISHGFITAGVVGSKKPFYDIWGDTVNMASRMDTTGVVDRIQVTEETAEIIQKFGYVCDCRGEILVKGKTNPVRTFFVALDDNFQLVQNKVEED